MSNAAQMILAVTILSLSSLVVSAVESAAGLLKRSELSRSSVPLTQIQSEIIEIAEGSMVVCSNYRSIQIMYRLAIAGEIKNVDGCWRVDAPMRIIILEEFSYFSSITYQNGTQKDWYNDPAWAFTQWLRESD